MANILSGKRFYLAFLILLAIALSSVTPAAQIRTDYFFNPPEIAQIKIGDQLYHRIIMDDASNSGLIGKPALPIRGAQILLPPGTVVENIEVQPGAPVILGDGYSVEPAARPVRLSAAPGSGQVPVPDADVYRSGNPFPESRFTEIGTYSFRGYNILTVQLHPMRYLPVSGELAYFPEMTVVVNTVESGRPAPLFRGLEIDGDDVRAKVDNDETADAYVSIDRGIDAAFDLLILTTPSLVSSFQPLKDYHDTTGIATEIHTTSDVGSTDPDDVRDYIRDRYIGDGISYVLIGGDDDLIPAKNLYVVSWEGADADIEYNMPGDIYFACLDGTYNYDGDALWGEPTDGEGGGDVDLAAEVYVGRASVGTTGEADRFVNQTIHYLTSQTTYLDSVLMCGEYLGFGGISDYAGNMMDEIVDSSNASSYRTIGIPSDKYSIDRLYDRDWSGNDWPVSELISRINNGLHVINHLGHGNTTSALKMTNGTILSSLTNDDYFFLYSQACYSGHFDDAECFAEYMNIKTDYGAFALVMNARYGYGLENSTDGPSQRYNRQFWDAVYNPDEAKPQLGRANHDSKEDNLHRINESCMRWCYYEVTLFGDPTVTIKGVRGVSFAYPGGIPEITVPDQTTTFTVVVTGIGDGAPVSGTGQLHYLLNGGPVQSAAMTEVLPGEYDAVLPALSCGDQLEFYVSVDEAVNGTVYDPQPSNPNVVAPGTAVVTAFADDFETDKGWSVSGGQWARGLPTGGGGEYGGPDPTSGCVGPNVFGYNLDGDYANNIPEYHLTSPAIDCSGLSNVHLVFQRWLGVEEPAYDHAYIRVSNDGYTWTTVWSNDWTVTDTSWVEMDLRLTEIADNEPTVYLRWTMGTTDEGWRFCGWNIDDVRLTAYQCQSGPLEIVTPSLPDWTAQYAFSRQLSASGGVGAYTWADKNGDLIGTGLSLSAGGILSGIPVTAGTIDFTAEVTDEESNTDEEPCSLIINEALTITTISLPDWTEGIAYSQQLIVGGGTGGNVWSDKTGALEGTGLSLSVLGLVSGTPAASGPLAFTALVADQVGADTEREYDFIINPAVEIKTLSLPVCSTSVPFSVTLSMSGGTGEKTWSDRDDDLVPIGFSLSAEGVLSGTAPDPDTITFTAQVADAVGSSDEQAISLEIVRSYVCGDANGDEAVNVGDAVYLIAHVFKGGPVPEPAEAGDANADGTINVGDAVYVINYVFKNGDSPLCP